MIFLYIFIFLFSCFFLYLSGEWLVGGLMRIARFLGWKEFVVAFFVMAISASFPNLFIGIFSAIQKIPQLSFGDVLGGNVVDLTIAVALAVFVAGGLPAESRTVQTSAFFTILIAILPLLLVWDGVISRADGVILIIFFCFYLFWLFSKKERFSRIYDGVYPLRKKTLNLFLKDFGKVFLGVILLLLSAQGIVKSSSFFAQYFNLSIAWVGLLIVGFGNSLPEIYFAIVSARKKETWMILGDLMGAVIVPATLVLGIVALICPIEISDFSPFLIARFFLIISTLFFLFFVRTEKKITTKEGIFLLFLYFAFLFMEMLTK